MQLLEKKYLEALESNLHKETQKEKSAKLFYINCAKKIQRFYRIHLLCKKQRAALIIYKHYSKWKKDKLKKQISQRQQNIRQVKSFFYQLKAITFPHKSNIIIKEKELQKLQPLIRLLKNYQLIKTAKRRKLILKLIQFKKVKLSLNKAKEVIKQYKLSYYKQQMKYQQQKIAIINEIQFISNLQELNNKYFELGLQNYQKQVLKSVQQKDYESDYIELKNNQGVTYWQNLKTLKKYNTNPIEQIINKTLDQLEEEQQESYKQQIQYLENGKEELINLLQELKPEQLPFPKM